MTPDMLLLVLGLAVRHEMACLGTWQSEHEQVFTIKQVRDIPSLAIGADSFASFLAARPHDRSLRRYKQLHITADFAR